MEYIDRRGFLLVLLVTFFAHPFAQADSKGLGELRVVCSKPVDPQNSGVRIPVFKFLPTKFSLINHTNTIQGPAVPTEDWGVWSPQDGVAFCEEGGATVERLYGVGTVDSIPIPKGTLQLWTGRWDIRFSDARVDDGRDGKDADIIETQLFTSPVPAKILRDFQIACGGRKLLVAATPGIADYPFQISNQGANFKTKVAGAFRAKDGKFVVLQSEKSRLIGQERSFKDFICLDLCDGVYGNHLVYPTERSPNDHFCGNVDPEL